MCPTGTTLHPISSSNGTNSNFRRAFDVIDADHDGKISNDDLRSFYTSSYDFRNGREDDMIRAMITVADANKDGYVQYDEFERVLYETKKEKEEEKCNKKGDVNMIEEVFKVMDKDGDGRLGVEDLRSYFKLAGINVGNDEIKAMIKLGSGDINNGVSFNGFLQVLALYD